MKFVNFRPMIFFVISLILGIVTSTYYFAGKISLPLYCLITAIIILLCILLIILIIIKRNNFIIKRVFKRCLYCIIAFIIGISTLSIFKMNTDKTQIDTDTYNITARVESIQVFYNNQDLSKVLVDQVIVEIGDDKFSLNGKMKVYFQGDIINYDLVIGNFIEFSGIVKSIKITDDNEINKNFNNLANNIFYSCNAKSEVIILDETRTSIFEEIRLNAKDIMDERFDEDISAIGYGMLFGEDDYIDIDIANAFDDAGISHLLAVSGLHVGFVVLLLSIILSLFRIQEKAKSIITIFILFIYVMLCGFSTSVVRAFIMTTCLLLSPMFNKKYDSLNSLGLAGCVILIFSPLDVFTVGFQLSFMAVLGIILLNPLISKFFSRFLFEQFASTLSVSLSASLGIMPIMIVNFHKFSALSVFTNMIVIPIASIAFMLLFLGVMLAMIIPSLSIIIVPFDIIMKFVTAIAIVASDISINMFNVNMGSAWIFFFLGLYAIISEYIRLKWWVKIVIVSILVLFYILILVL